MLGSNLAGATSDFRCGVTASRYVAPCCALANEKRSSGARGERTEALVLCLYPYYVETFYAAGAALRRNDEEWLASIRAGAETLEDRHARVAALAMHDAASGSPLRARVNVCEAFVSEECTGGSCPQSRGCDLLVDDLASVFPSGNRALRRHGS